MISCNIFFSSQTDICFLCKNNKKIAIVIRHLLVIFEDLTWNVVICVFSESVMNGHYITLYFMTKPKKSIIHLQKYVFFWKKISSLCFLNGIIFNQCLGENLTSWIGIFVIWSYHCVVVKQKMSEAKIICI